MYDRHAATPQEDDHPDLLAELEQLHEALSMRTTTAQATGVLASRFHLHTDQAWALLRETSNMSNRKLNDIARIVIDTHNNTPILDETDQQVAIDLVTVLDRALLRIHARLDANRRLQQHGRM